MSPRKQKAVSVTRTPVDTIDAALRDLARQEISLKQQLKVTDKLKEGLIKVREKAIHILEGQFKLLPPSDTVDAGTRNVGFLGAGLAARAAEVIETNGAPLHIKAIQAQLSLQPGLIGLTEPSLRGTMNSDCKRKHPRLVSMGDGYYGLAGVHDVKGYPRKRLKAA